MKKSFDVIAIIGKPRDQSAIQTHRELYQWLSEQGYSVFIDDRLSNILSDIPPQCFSSLLELGKKRIWPLLSAVTATCLVQPEFYLVLTFG